MSSDESDKHCSNIKKKYHGNQSIIIAPDIKYKPVIPNSVNTVKVLKI